MIGWTKPRFSRALKHDYSRNRKQLQKKNNFLPDIIPPYWSKSIVLKKNK